MPVYGLTSVRTANRFGPYQVPSASGQIIVVGLYYFPDGGAATATVLRTVQQRVTGATVTVLEPEHSNSRSPNQAGASGVVETVNPTASGNPFNLIGASPEQTWTGGHYQYPRPGARFVTNAGEQSNLQTNVSSGAGIALSTGARFYEGGLSGAIDRVARRPREHGWWHRCAQKRHKVQAGTTPPAAHQVVHDRANWNVMTAARQAYLREHDTSFVLRAGVQTTQGVTDQGVTQTDDLTTIGVDRTPKIADLGITRPRGSTFEGFTNGSAPATTDQTATQDAPNTVGAAATYDNTQVMHGSMALRLAAGTGTNEFTYAQSKGHFDPDDGSARAYVYVANAPSAQSTFISMLGFSAATIGMDTAGHVVILSSTGAVLATSTSTYLAAYFRAEWTWDAAQQLVVRLYSAPDSTGAATETLNGGAATANVLGTIGLFQMQGTDVWFDDVLIGGGYQAWLGPSSTTPYTPGDSLAATRARVITDTGASQSDSIGRLVSYNVIDTGVARGTIYADAFGRSVAAGGWGSADTGQAWTPLGTTTASFFSVDGAEGQVTITTNSTQIVGIDAGGGFSDGDLTMDMNMTVLPTSGQGANMGVGVRTQATNPEQNYYRARIIADPAGGNPTIELAVVVANVATIIGSVTSSFALTASAWWRIHVAANGSRLQVRAWPTSSGEPSSWDVDVTDTQWASGGMLIRAQQTNGARPVFNYDNLAATSRAADSVTATKQAGGAQTTRNITDTGTSQSDAIGRAIVRAVIQTGVTQTDVMATTRQRTIATTGVSQSDSIGPRHVVRAVVDTGESQTDSPGRAVARAVATTGVTQTDTIGRAVTRIIADTGTAQTDSIGPRQVMRAVVDTGESQSDSLIRPVVRAIADTGASQSDSLVRAIIRGVTSQGVTQTDSPGRAVTRPIIDTGESQTDVIGPRILVRAVTDTGEAQSDALARAVVRGVVDTGEAQTDSVVAQRGFLRAVSDTGEAQSDSLTRAVVRQVASTGVVQTDAVARAAARAVADTGTAQSDSIGRAVARAVVSTGVAQTDSVTASAGGHINPVDTGTSQSDAIVPTITRPVTSTGVTQSDSVTATRAATRNVTDQGESQSDALAVARIRAISDTGASQTDSPATARTRAIATIGESQTDAVARSVTRRVTDTGESQSDSLGGAQSFSRNVTDTGLAQSDQVGLILQPYGVTDYGVGERVAADEFNRTVTATTAASWGALVTGQTWATLATGSGQTYGVNGSQATNTVPAGNSARRGQSISAGGVNQEAVAAIALDVTPVGGAYISAIYLRVTDVNNLYGAEFLVTAAGNIQYRLRKVIGGTGTVIAAATNVPGIGTYTPGGFIWVRGRIEGQTLSVKVWKDGTPEPGAWTVQVVDAAISTGTLMGVGGQANSSQTNAQTQLIDHFAGALIQSDTVGRTVTPTLADTGASMTDSVGRSLIATRGVIDTGAAQSDAVIRTLAATARLTDQGASQTDQVKRAAARLVADTGVVQVDAVARQIARRVIDQGESQADSPAATAAGNVNLVDQGVSMVDAARRAVAHAIVDTGTAMSDAIRAARGIAVVDAGATIADSLARLLTASRQIADVGAAMSDLIVRAVARPIIDVGVSMSDSPTVTAQRLIVLADRGEAQTDSLAVASLGHAGVTDIGDAQTDAIRRAIARRLADTGIAQTDVTRIVARHLIFLADRGVRFFDFVGAIRRVLTSVEGATGQAQARGATGEQEVRGSTRPAGPRDGTHQPIVYAHTED